MSWFAKGNDIDKFKEENKNQFQVWKFRLKPGEKRKVLFLEDEGLLIKEGTIKLSHNSFETFTCSTEADSYFLQRKLPTVFTHYYTVLDLTPYKAKDGTERKYSKRAFAARGMAMEVLKRRRAEKGSLTGWIIECVRDTEKSPSVGNDFVMVDKFNLSTLPADDIKVFNWQEVLKPVKAEVIEARLRFGSQAPSHGNAEPEILGRSQIDSAEDAPF